jgi:hypothetical protein
MKRLPMRKIREALRLRSDGFSGRLVAQSLGLGRATISEYFRRADVEGLSWPLPTDLSDADLEHRLFPYSPGEVRRGVPQPDWAYVHPKARSECIRHHGLSCAACDFNFNEVYGKIGNGHIHVHHITPLSEVGERYEVNPIEDLIPVCPNCHAMLHTSSPPFTVAELQKKILRGRK